MKRFLSVFNILIFFVFAPFVYADGEKKIPLGFSFLWSGNWEQDGSLVDRVDTRLSFPFGFSLRGQVVDKRPALPWEQPDAGSTDWGAGVYHKSTGSRALFGKLKLNGLSNRVNNVWAHSVPWLETHTVTSIDIKTSPAENSEYSGYLSIISPRLRFFSPYISYVFNERAEPDLTAGMNIFLPYNSTLNVETFYTEKVLPEKDPSAWFSSKSYLPERKMRLYAISLVVTNPYVSFAGDFAHSEVFAFGEDIYANAALRIGNRQWRFSLSADGSGARYSGFDGVPVGEGFRSGAKFEYWGKRNSNFKIATTLKADGWGKPFDQSKSSIAYKFPLIKKFQISPSKFSLNIERNAENSEKILDLVDLKTTFLLGPLRPAVGIKWLQSCIASPGDKIIPYPDITSDHDFESLKLTGDLVCSIFFVDLKGSFSWTFSGDKESAVGSSFSAGIHGKYGRLNIKVSNQDNSDIWKWMLSWRLQGKFGG